MNELNVSYMDVTSGMELEEVKTLFDGLDFNTINCVNWSDYPYKPEVSFRIFYTSYAIYIRYDIFEQSVLALKQSVNDPVYRDSCVEFFISPKSNCYYNFEFNAIGTPYGGYKESGKGVTMSDTDVSTIRTLSTLGTDPFEEIEEATSWSLTVEIPLSLFIDRDIEELRKSSMTANFYKCGDEMKVPHYISWNQIVCDKPDFHRPEDFGIIHFL